MTSPVKKKSSAGPLRLSGREGLLRLGDGRLLSFQEFGAPDGLPFFGFHGTPGSRFMFQLTDEAARYCGIRIIAPERPGFGRSTFQKNRKLRDWPKDVEALADALGLSRFGVAGVSGGGPYAAAVAALLPERVAVMALISPIGPVRPPEAPDKIGRSQYFTFRLLSRLPLLMYGSFSFGRLLFLHARLVILAMIMGRAAPADWPILARREVRENLLDGVSEGMRPGVRGSTQEMRIFSKPWNIPFGAIRAPALLWQGTADRNVPVSASFRLGELVPGCRVFSLEGAGHYWIFDHIPEVLQAMRRAWDENRTVTGKGEVTSAYRETL